MGQRKDISTSGELYVAILHEILAERTVQREDVRVRTVAMEERNKQ